MKKLLILAGIVAMTCSTQVFAQENAVQDSAKAQVKVERAQEVPHCKKAPHKQKCDFKKFEDELNLTVKQKEQLKQLREAQREEAKPIVQQLKQKEQEVRELKGQLRALHEKNKKDFEAILTDKQLKKLKEMKAEHKKQFSKCHKKHHHNGHRPAPQDKCNQK